MPGFVSHIDFRVRNAAEALPFYDALFAALGMREGPTRTAVKSYARWDPDGVRIEWFNLYEDSASMPSPTRIAFRVNSNTEVDEVFQAIRAYARNIEGPESVERGGKYNMSYYGLFFEDTFGNKFEVCNCIMRR
ncbi:MAG TPA: VOC family protein [Candidatus Eremiobacteraceae bacterium]|nr:VOC family protein [Candidatus Eremiobacteraceae bacterium]